MAVSPKVPDVASPSGWQRRAGLWLALTFVASMVVVSALLALDDSGRIHETLARLKPEVIAGLLALSLFNYVARALRWHIYCEALQLRVPLGTGSLYYFAGFAMSVTPGRIGEAVRLWFLRRTHGHSYERTLALIAADRIADATTLIIIGLIGIALLGMSAAAIAPMALITLAAIFLAARPRYLAAMVGFGYRIVGRWPRLFGRLRVAVRQLGKLGSPAHLLCAFALSIVGWFAEVVEVWWVVHACGGTIGIWEAAVAFSVSMVVGAATMIPGGLGGTEIGMVALLTQRGVSWEIAVTTTAVIRLTTLWFSVGVGMVALPLAIRRATRTP